MEGERTLKRAAHRAVLSAVLLGALLANPPCCHALQKVFVGSASEDWMQAENWDPAGLPGSADDVEIGTGRTAVLNVAATVRSLALAGTLAGAGNLSVTGVTQWSAGAMSGTGVTNANGGLRVVGGLGKRLERTLNHSGQGQWSDLGILSVSGTFNNLQDATFAIRNDRPVQELAPSARFNNAGTVLKIGGSQRSLVGIPFYNAGVVSVASGTLSLDRGGAHGGRFEATSGTLELSGGDHVMHGSVIEGGSISFGGANVEIDGLYRASATTVTAGTVAFTGDVQALGPLVVSNGTVSFDNPTGVVETPLLRFSAGTIAGSSNLNVSGRISWSGGTMAGTGVTNANGGLTLEGSASRRLDRTLNHSGQGTWTGTANLGISGTFLNLAGATFEIQNDRAFAGSGANARIVNAGTLRKTMGMPTGSSAISFENRGLVEIVHGVLSIHPAYVQTDGITRLHAGAVLRSTDPVAIEAGRLEGSGSVEAPLVNGSEVLPGLPLGPLGATRSYSQRGTGTLRVEIGGVGEGQFDRLVVAETASLGGTLRVDLGQGYVPRPGDSFSILRFAELEGGFTEYQGVRFGGGRGFSVLIGPNEIELRYGIESCADGVDNDGDGLADCADGKCADVCAATPTVTASPAPSPTSTPCFSACVGDCDCDGMIRLAELLAGLDLALESREAISCVSFDRNASNGVEIQELVAAVARHCARP